MYCRKCGRALESGVKYCPECGTPVSGSSTSSSSSSSSSTSERTYTSSPFGWLLGGVLISHLFHHHPHPFFGPMFGIHHGPFGGPHGPFGGPHGPMGGGFHGPHH